MKVIDQTENFFEKRFGEKKIQETIDLMAAFETAYSTPI
jgi:hypothetical protein